MNRIKYINTRTGQTASVRIGQVSWATRVASYKIWGCVSAPTMREADEHMRRQGFVRAGARWRGKIARLALRNLRIQNALTDNAMLVKAP